MADNVITFSVLNNDAPNVAIAMRTYQLAERQLVLGQYAAKYTLEQRMGTTLRVIRHKRIGLPIAPLSEGVTPDSRNITLEKVDVTPEQWGLVVTMTDISQITLKHPILAKAVELGGMALSETIEREIAEVLMGGTGVIYVGGGTRTSLGTGDILASGSIFSALSSLRTLGAMPVRGSLYGGVIPPQMEMDMMADDTFKTATTRQNIEALEYGRIGFWAGVEWMRGNFLPTFRGVAASTTAAANATKAQHTDQATGGTFSANEVVKLVVVARDALTDYERKISQTASVTMGAGTNVRSLDVKTPTSTNYVYDIYASKADGGDPFLWLSRVANSTTKTLTEFSDVTGTASPPEAPADTIETFVAWIFGKDAFMRVELNGMSMQSFRTPDGASDSDPLNQRKKVGWKVMFKCGILDDNYMRRIEAISTYGAELPA